MADEVSPFVDPDNRITNVSNEHFETRRTRILTANAIQKQVRGKVFTTIMTLNNTTSTSWSGNILKVQHNLNCSDLLVFIRDIKNNDDYHLDMSNVRQNSFEVDCTTIMDKLTMLTDVFKLYALPLANVINNNGEKGMYGITDSTTSNDTYIWVGDRLIVQHGSGMGSMLTRFYDEVTLEELIPTILMENTNETIFDFTGITTTNNYISTIRFNDLDMFRQEFVLGTDTPELTHVGNTIEITHGLNNVNTLVYVFDITTNEWMVVEVTNEDDLNSDIIDLDTMMTSSAGNDIRITVMQFTTPSDTVFTETYVEGDMVDSKLILTHNFNTVHGIFKIRDIDSGMLYIPNMSTITNNTVEFDMSGIVWAGHTFEITMLT